MKLFVTLLGSLLIVALVAPISAVTVDLDNIESEDLISQIVNAGKNLVDETLNEMKKASVQAGEEVNKILGDAKLLPSTAKKIVSKSTEETQKLVDSITQQVQKPIYNALEQGGATLSNQYSSGLETINQLEACAESKGVQVSSDGGSSLTTCLTDSSDDVSEIINNFSVAAKAVLEMVTKIPTQIAGCLKNLTSFKIISTVGCFTKMAASIASSGISIAGKFVKAGVSVPTKILKIVPTIGTCMIGAVGGITKQFSSAGIDANTC